MNAVAKVLIQCAVAMFRAEYVVGESVYVKRLVTYIRWLRWKSRLRSIGRRTKIYGNVVIRAPDRVTIGAHVVIADFVHIWGGGGVTIGDNVIVASHAAITSQTHDTEAELYQKSSIMKPVTIGKNVWIGSGAIILPGVSIGDNSIIGAGAVVTRDVPPCVIVAGIPARTLRQLYESKDVIL